MNKTLQKLIEDNYTFKEAEEIKQFFKDKRLDKIVQKAIDEESNEALRDYDENFEND